MRRGSVFLLTLVGVVCAGVVIAGATLSEAVDRSWRYKITVTVETPEGEVSGSAVRQVNAFSRPPLLGEEDGDTIGVIGEAVVINLGDRGVIFSLINWASYKEVFQAFSYGGPLRFKEKIRYYASLPIGTKAEMPLSSAYPKFVTFTDMHDPKSVTLVYQRSLCREAKPLPEACAADPKGSYASTDRFEELFGDGVKLKDITLEITDEPVTWGVVDQWLPPSGMGAGFKEWRKSLGYGHPLAIDRSNFKRAK